MNGVRVGTWACVVVSAACWLLSGVYWAGGSSPTSTTDTLAFTNPGGLSRGEHPNIDSLDAVATRGDPFRQSRRPAPVPFDPVNPTDAPPPPAAPRPSLALVGILIGDEPAALIDGLPGVDGTRVLRVGETAAGYTVRRIEPDRVTVQGADTTWTLTVRSPQ